MLRNYQSARKGETHITNEGFTATIIKYNCSTDVDIQFDDEFNTVIKCRYCNLVAGTVKNPNNRTLCGRGYVGIGEYQPTKIKNRIQLMMHGEKCLKDVTEKNVCKLNHHIEDAMYVRSGRIFRCSRMVL